MQQASEARRDITAFEDSLQPHPLEDRTTVFSSDATSDLYARLGTHTRVDIPTIFQSEHFNLMQRVDSVPFSEAVQKHLRMFMWAGTGDKETDRCCLLMVDLSW